jgi:hypothetical protein
LTALLLLRVATRPFASLAPFHAPRAAAAARELAGLTARLSAETEALERALYEAAGPRAAEDDPEAARARVALLAVRRDVHQRRVPRPRDLDAASLPGPLCAALDRVLAAQAAVARAEAAWREALGAEILAGRRALAEAVSDPLVAEGIGLAARSLAVKVAALRGKDPAAWGHGDRHVAAKALSYVARFATKTSPNGVFCATALARAEGSRCAVSGSPAIVRRDLILSIAEARKVACTLAFDPAAERAVVPRPNPTLRREEGGLTFWRFASARNPNDDETLARVKDHPVVDAALEEAAAGTLTFPDLRRRLSERCGLLEADLAPFLRQLAERGILIAEIGIPYNARRPLRHVASTARDAGCAEPWVDRVLAIESEVDRLAETGTGSAADERGRIAADLEALPRAREIAGDELFRLDAAAGVDLTLPSAILDELASGLESYLRLFAALYPARRALAGWTDRFLARFPPDTDVPLLDVYRAIREEGNTYRPAAFPEPSSGREGDASRRAMDAVRAFFVEANSSAAPIDELTFDAAVLERLVPGAPRPRWACGVLAQIAARDPDAISRGDYRLVLNGLFHGAGLSLSRFAHLLGGPGEGDANPVVRELRRAWSVIERPDAVIAELTYNHLGRTANAGLRPAIFRHEIELPGDTASPGAVVLGLNDLVLRWDRAADRFVLREVARGFEVIPVINSGVNPVGFISLLVAIGEQGLQPLGYFPGLDDPAVVHWRRVVAGKLVLFRERWTFRRDLWPAAPARGDDPEPFAREAARWSAAHSLPRHVFVHTTREPKPRYIDLESPLFVDLLRRDLAALDGEADAVLHVTEMLPAPEDLWLRGEGGPHAAEILVQMSG